MPKEKKSDTTANKLFFLIQFCFFLSGLSGLIYEILWARMIVKIIGAAPFAVSIILTIFMGGLGLGSYLAGRLIDRIEEPLVLVKIYGILELIIGAFAVVIPLLLNLVLPLQTFLYNALYAHFFIYNLLTFIVCSIILCIPITCMGATLPILCRFYVSSLSHIGTYTGRLYGLNTIGAALGSLLCGFWLINFWGVSGTMLFAVLINVTIGIICLIATYKGKIPSVWMFHKTLKPKENTLIEETENGHPKYHIERRGVLLIFVVSGFCAMACEVIWTRLLALIVGPTTYSFTIVLVTFITGLAIGSMIFGYFADKFRKPMWLLLFTQIGAAMLVLIVSQVLGTSQMFFSKLMFTFQDNFGLLNLLKAIILFTFMILPTLCFGAAFPLVGKIYTESVSKVGESIGFAYMLNTVGSLLGSFCAGFLLIPIAGKESTLKMIVSLQLVTSLVIAIVMLKNRKGRIVQFGFTALVAATGLVLCFFYPVWNHQQLAIGKYHRFQQFRQSLTNVGWLESLLHGAKILAESDEGELVYYGDGIGGFTTVLMNINALGNTNYSMRNSGKVDASTSEDMATQTLSAHFPMLFHKNPKTVMVVGLASGITAGEVLYYPVKQLDILEINDQVISASDFFVQWNNKVLADPKTNLIIQDARAHLQHTGQKYDVIISEPSNPWMAGLAALFTYEYFSLVRDRLNDGGVFVQWLQAYQMDWETFATVGRTFLKKFPNSILVNTEPSTGGSDFLLVGFKNKDRLELGHAEQNSGYVRESKNVTLLDTRLLYRLIVSENLQRLFGQGGINTDNRPLLEFAAPRLMYFSDAAFIQKKIKERTILSAETQKMVWETAANVDAQIDNAAFALSVQAPFSHMVDLSKTTSLQKDRFFYFVEKYCASNEFDASVFKDNELNQRCLSVQIEIINSRLDRLSERRRSWSYLGNLYMETGRTSEAVNCFSEALRIDPDSVEAHYNLAIALAKQGRTAEAIEHYLQALRIKPDYVEAHNNLGNALAKQGRTAEAIEHYLQALRIKPDSVEAHYNLAIALSRKGDIEGAITHFRNALRINPDNIHAKNNLKKALMIHQQNK